MLTVNRCLLCDLTRCEGVRLVSSSAPMDPELIDVITLAMEKHRVPGVAVGVHLEGREETVTMGLASAERADPVTPDTPFEIASITKTVVSTLLGRLAETGVLDLDLPVRTYLPDLRLADESVASRVTLRH